ncbi:MAG: hypothetical protein P4L73_16675 [Caulobacteraceae bacterium]|nr:hypothetical protein [Caulobacteraceae bacterium]
MGAVERPARLDLSRLGAGIGYRETGDPFAGEIGLPNPRTGQCAPREAAALGVLIGRLGVALVAAWSAFRKSGTGFATRTRSNF